MLDELTIYLYFDLVWQWLASGWSVVVLIGILYLIRKD